MNAPKKIWAWPDRGRRESVTGRWSCNTYSSDLTEAYILAAEHERIVADYLAVIDHLHHEHDYWRGRAEFAEAQFEALAEMAPPPQKGLLLRRLKELAAKRRGGNG